MLAAQQIIVCETSGYISVNSK